MELLFSVFFFLSRQFPAVLQTGRLYETIINLEFQQTINKAIIIEKQLRWSGMLVERSKEKKKEKPQRGEMFCRKNSGVRSKKTEADITIMQQCKRGSQLWLFLNIEHPSTLPKAGRDFRFSKFLFFNLAIL